MISFALSSTQQRMVMLASMTMLVCGCASAPNRNPIDPLEPTNRAIYSFNDALDRHVAEPVARSYVKTVPEPMRQMVNNVFSNLGEVGNLANNLLQGNLTASVETLMRFSINSTIGLGGLIDWASPSGLIKQEQDFGLTLGKWGVPTGPYLMLPLFGPSNIRDAIGTAAGMPLDPATYVPSPASFGVFGANVVSTRARYLDATDLLEKAALDKYAFIRDAYLGRRRALLLGSHQDTDLPSYEDEADTSGKGTDNSASPAP